MASKIKVRSIGKNDIRSQLNELLKKIDNPKVFVSGLHEMLQSCADEEASSSYRKLVPEIGESFGTPKPVLVMIANELGKYGQKSHKLVLSLLDTLWENGSYEERDIVGKTIEKLGKKYPDE